MPWCRGNKKKKSIINCPDSITRSKKLIIVIRVSKLCYLINHLYTCTYVVSTSRKNIVMIVDIALYQHLDKDTTET